MANVSDYVGKRFGNLIVIGLDESFLGKTYNANRWIFECDCGNRFSSAPNRVLSGHKKSCGCRKINRITTHGCCKTPFYHSWWSMMQRCYNPKHHNYKRYGQRGITVCDEWHNVQKFTEWANATRPGKDLTLDRINNDGNYEPANCIWVSAKDQSRNRTVTQKCTINGITKPLAEWCEEYNMPLNVVSSRLRTMEWDAVKALTTPVTHFDERGAKVEIEGENKSIKEWCEIYGISRSTVYGRFHKGMDIVSAITTPVGKKSPR